MTLIPWSGYALKSYKSSKKEKKYAKVSKNAFYNIQRYVFKSKKKCGKKIAGYDCTLTGEAFP